MVAASVGTQERTLAEALGDFGAQVLREGAPQAVETSVRQRVLDILGLAAAAVDTDTSRSTFDFVRAQGSSEQAHAVGFGTTTSVWAAFLNGVLAHTLDYDDTHLPSILHPSASVVPAALAAAESSGATGRELSRAVAVGLEITVRLGMAGFDRGRGNSTFFEHGQHATSICGAIGSAAAAALLQTGTASAVVDAMGVAASMASGLIEANRTGGTVKRIHCGWAAHAGVSAAQLVAHGLTGPPTVFEGRFGFFEAFLGGTYDPEEITRDLGRHWEVPGIFFKPYPANHFTHTAIDAAVRLRHRGVVAEDVSELHLGVAGPTVRTIGEPIAVKRAPATGYQGQFSGPYAVTAALLGGHGLGVGLDDFTDALVRDPARTALMQRVTVEADATCDQIYPYQFPAVLRARLRDGSEVVEEVLVNRGGLDNPLTDDELSTKFRDNAIRLVDPGVSRDLEDVVGNLHDVTRVSDLLEPLSMPAGSSAAP